MLRINQNAMNIPLILLFTSQLVLQVNSLVSDWGEPCQYTVECTDHRLICDNKTFICVCDRFHEWRGFETRCYLKYNISTIMNMTTVQSNNALELLEKEREIIFTTNMVAGLFVLIMVALSIVAVFGFCICVRRQDAKLKEFVMELQSKKRTERPQRFA